MKLNYFSFKKLLIGFSFGFLPIGILVGVLTLAKITPVHFNDKSYYGFQGLLISLLATLFLALIFSILFFIILNIGIFLFNLFSKKNNGDTRISHIADKTGENR
ncbi:MAG: hypothetical protein ACTHMM_26920 [Agriterribacter sp.]